MIKKAKGLGWRPYLRCLSIFLIFYVSRYFAIPLSVTMQRAQNKYFHSLHYEVSLVMLNPHRSALCECALMPYKIFCVVALGDNAVIFRRMARELRSQVGLPVYARQSFCGIDEASTNWA